MSADAYWVSASIADANTGGSAPASADLKLRLPSPALAGNCLMIILGYAAASGVLANLTTLTFSDNIGGNTYDQTSVGSFDDTVNVYRVAVILVPNVAAGTQEVTVHFNGTSTPIAIQRSICQLYNVPSASYMDGTPVKARVPTVLANAAIQGGNHTTSVNGSRVIQIAVQDGSSGSGRMTADTGFALQGVGESASWGFQSTILDTAGALNPGIKCSQASDWISIVFALKTSLGSGNAPDPSKPNIRYVNHAQFGGTTTPLTFQVPTKAGTQLMVGLFSGEGTTTSPVISTVSGSLSGTHVVKASAGDQLKGVCQAFYREAPTAVGDSEEVTVNFSGADNGAGSNLFAYVIECNVALTFDAIAQFTGNDTVGGALTIGSLAPARPGGVMLANVSVADGHMTAMTSPWTAHNDEDLNSAGTSSIDEDNGWGHVVPTSTSAQSAVWSDSFAFAGQWSGQILSFVPVLGASGGRRLVNPRRSPFSRPGTRLRTGLPRRFWAGDIAAATTQVTSDNVIQEELLRGLAASTAVIDESLQGIAGNQTVQEEGLQSVSQGVTVIEEALQQLATLATVITEALQGLVVTSVVPEETLGSTSQVLVVQDEALASVSGGQAVVDEALGAVTLVQQVIDEALGGLVASQTVQDESLGLTAVSIDVVVPLEALGSAAQGQTTQEEALASASTGQAVQDESLQGIATGSTVLDEALASVSTGPTVQDEAQGVVTTPVSNSVTVILEALQQVGPTPVVVLEVTQLVTQQQVVVAETLVNLNLLQTLATEGLASLNAVTTARLEALVTALAGLLIVLEAGGSALVILARAMAATRGTDSSTTAARMRPTGTTRTAPSDTRTDP